MNQKTLGVKLNEAEAAAFQQWCTDNGMNTSHAISLFVECILKLQKGSSMNNEKMLSLIQQWDSFRDIEKVTNAIAPNAEMEVIEAIYMVQEKGKRGVLPVLVEPSFMSEPHYSTDVNEIIEELLHCCSRGLHRRLKSAGNTLSTSSAIDTITALIEYFEINEDTISNQVQEMFADNTRHQSGRTSESIMKYKPHNRKNIDTQLTLFNNEQRHQLQQDNELQGVEDTEG